MVLRRDGKPSILYIDAFDSFSNNIVGLLETRLDAEVSVVRIDDCDIRRVLDCLEQNYDAVVAGPGPGHPGNPADVGLISDLWKRRQEMIVPVLGICLGFQSLGLAFGGRVEKLEHPQHGITTTIVHHGDDIFQGMGAFQAVQYHSLFLRTGHSPENSTSGDSSGYPNGSQCPQLLPLAWQIAQSGHEPILMAVRHAELPFWGLQFHPESISTDTECHKLLDAWWHSVQHWHATETRATASPATLELAPSPYAENRFLERANFRGAICDESIEESCHLSWEKVSSPGVSVVELVEELKVSTSEMILLDSQGHQGGRYSILGLILHQRTVKVTYYGATQSLHQQTAGYNPQTQANFAQHEVWALLQSMVESHYPTNGSNDLPSDCPFWGGFMGYVSYEAGLDSISVERSLKGDDVEQPDFNLAFIERSIVIDHATGVIYILSLVQNDSPWIKQTTNLVEGSNFRQTKTTGTTADAGLRQPLEELFLLEQLKHAKVIKPSEGSYRRGVLDCQEALRAGDSYELCLTGDTQVLLPLAVDPWILYKRLRKENAAPHGAFVRLSGATVLSSSPERFLRWDRRGKCQFRPIKGTVKKGADMTYEKARAILSTSKEMAENLMIVDLIRHDLSGVIGARNVSVPQLMQVEEHATVYSLVSVIEGQIPRQVSQSYEKRRLAPDVTSVSGIDVLKASLPPGSMTGAPKRRSCQILTELEQRPRGIYSGVLGYIDVGGGGDFSVVIRSAFSYDRQMTAPSVTPIRADPGDLTDGSSSSSSLSPGSKLSSKSTPASSYAANDGPHQDGYKIWHIGAGGAVTAQSTDKGEFEEMETKLNSVLKTFVP